MKPHSIRVDLRVAILYAFFGTLWILFSDTLLAAAVSDPAAFTRLQTYKGWAFVALSALVIFLLLRRELALRRITEEKFDESEERYRQLFEHSMDAILLTAPDGRVLAANPAACKMFERTEDEIIKLGRDGLVDTSDPRLKAALEERTRAGRFHGELTYLRADGTKFEGEVTSNIYKSRDGLERTSMIIRDITGRKRAEEALRESEERYRLISSLASDYMFDAHVDEDGQLQLKWVAGAFEGITGYRLEEFIARGGWRRIVHPDDLTVDDHNMEKLRSGRRVISEIRILTKSGGTRWAQIYAQPVMDPESRRLVGIYGAVQEISERKRAEAQSLRLNRLYATLSEINHTIVRVTDRETLFMDICRAAVRHGGYRMAWIGLINESTHEVEPAAFAGEERGYLKNVRIKYLDEALGRGPTGTAIREGRLVICQDIAADPTMEPWREAALQRGYRSSAAIPIRQRGRTIGAFMVYGAEPYIFDVGDENLLNEIGSDISFALDHIQSVTEGRLAEEALRLSEERFSNAFHTSPAGLTITRVADGKFVEANESFCKMFEYTHDEVIGRTSTELNMWTPEERRKLIEEQIKSGGLQNFELQARAKSGRVVDILFSSKPMETGGETHHITTMIDITERKRAEKELRESEDKFKHVFETANVGKSITLPTGEISVNHAFADLLGYSRDELASKNWQELTPSDEVESIQQILSPLLNGEKDAVRFNKRYIHRNGSFVWADVSVAIRRDAKGKPLHFITTVVDITERKRAEEALRETHSRLANLIATTPGIVCSFRLKPDGSVSFPFGGERIAETYGVAEGRLEEDATPFFALVHPDDLEGLRGSINDSARSLSIWRHEWRVRHPVRGEMWVEGHSVPLREPDGSTVWHGVATDITERKRAEQELRLSRDRLKELSRRLAETREVEARAIARELHDQIGQMLTAMKITLDLAGQLPADAATKKVEQARDLAGDLLQRVSRLSLELRPPMLDDLGLIPALVWHVTQYQEGTGILVDFKHDGVEGRRFAAEVETAAYRIVQEALTNAARHARAGRVRLEVRVETRWMEIRIEDDGAGFDPQAALKKNRGLSGMKERAELVGGTFHIESEKGRGTRKLIRLPVQ